MSLWSEQNKFDCPFRRSASIRRGSRPFAFDIKKEALPPGLKPPKIYAGIPEMIGLGSVLPSQYMAHMGVCAGGVFWLHLREKASSPRIFTVSPVYGLESISKPGIYQKDSYYNEIWGIRGYFIRGCIRNAIPIQRDQALGPRRTPCSLID